MRNSFVKTLIEEAKINRNLMLLTGDLGYAVLEPFRELFPSQFLNVGIAEQNMAGLAAGLAKEGKTVFFYSIGNFPTLRCLEQIRYDICYHNLDVKVVAVGSGYAYGPLGVSHHTTEDIGILRTIPNLMICAPGDISETRECVRLLSKNNKPSYLRINKAGEKDLHKSLNTLDGNEFLPMIKGEKTAILATGAILQDAHQYLIDNPDLKYSLYSFPFIRDLESNSLIRLFNSYSHFVTLEEHQLNCGFGSAIVEYANDLFQKNLIKAYPKLKRIGIGNSFVSIAGTQEYLRTKSGLDLQHVMGNLNNLNN